MRTMRALALAALLLAGWAPTAPGAPGARDVDALAVRLILDREARVAVAEVALAAPADLTRAKIGFAAIEFDAPLPEGSIVELWVTEGDDTALPWTAEAEVSGRKIQHWVVDEFTGSWVRLDVTRVLRGIAGTEAVQQLYIRVVDEEGEPLTLDFAKDGGPRLTEVRLP